MNTVCFYILFLYFIVFFMDHQLVSIIDFCKGPVNFSLKAFNMKSRM